MHQPQTATGAHEESVEMRFDRIGAVSLPGLFPPHSVAEMARGMGGIIERGHDIPESLEPEYEPDSDVPRMLRRPYRNDEHFWAARLNEAGSPSLAERHVGAPVTLTFHAVFLKPAGVGTAVALHQDQALWEQDYPGASSLWVALKPATRANGCLIGCPGSTGRSTGWPNRRHTSCSPVMHSQGIAISFTAAARTTPTPPDGAWSWSSPTARSATCGPAIARIFEVPEQGP